MTPFALMLFEGGADVAGQVSNVQSILGLITTVAGLIIASWIFLVPQALKIAGRAIGWAKSLMGTGGRRRR